MVTMTMLGPPGCDCEEFAREVEVRLAVDDEAVYEGVELGLMVSIV